MKRPGFKKKTTNTLKKKSSNSKTKFQTKIKRLEMNCVPRQILTKREKGIADLRLWPVQTGCD